MHLEFCPEFVHVRFRQHPHLAPFCSLHVGLQAQGGSLVCRATFTVALRGWLQRSSVSPHECQAESSPTISPLIETSSFPGSRRSVNNEGAGGSRCEQT